MRRVGFSVPVAEAVEDVKPFADLVTTRDGGRGAVREVCDFLLKKSGRWAAVANRYFED
jgi:3-deoxy-D-manno-octulosonate 8-phosphate phosphatase (KDO 8-P phosphatase)